MECYSGQFLLQFYGWSTLGKAPWGRQNEAHMHQGPYTFSNSFLLLGQINFPKVNEFLERGEYVSWMM